MISPNLTELARRHGTTRESLRHWRNAGLDLTDDAAIAARVANSKAAKPTGDLAAAKLEKLNAEIARIRHAHAVECGRYVDAALVAADGARIGQTVRGCFDKLAQGLPPQLAGRDAAEILTILRRTFRSTLEELAKHPSPIRFQDEKQ